MLRVKKENIILFLMALIIFISEIKGLNAIIIKLIVYLSVFLYCKKENMLKYFIIFNCLSSGITLYLLNLLFGIIYIVRNKGRLNVKKGLLVIMLGFLELMHSILILMFDELNTLVLVEQIFCFINFGIYGLLISDENVQKKSGILMKTYINSCIVMAIILLIKRLNYYGFDIIFKMANGIGTIPNDKYYSLFFNSNTVSARLGLSLALDLAIIGIKRKIRVLDIVQIIITIVLGLMTFSLSFLLYGFICICLFIVYTFSFKKRKLLLLLVFVLISFFIFVLITHTTFYDKIFSIYRKSVTTQDISNGRIDIYKYYVNLLKSNLDILFLGRGLTTYELLNENGERLAAHNALLEVVLAWGLIGMFVLILFIYKIFIRKTKNKINLYVYIPIICILLYMITGNFFIGYYSSLLEIVVAYATLFIGGDQSERND